MEEDINRTAAKVFIPPLKAAIIVVHRQQIDIKWAESWAAESKKKSFYSYAKGIKETGKCTCYTDENGEDRPTGPFIWPEVDR